MIGNVLNLKQLEALVWVAELGGFRKAAHHLNTTQPNISSRISTLEKTLGVMLMHRDAGSVRLTEKGHEILTAAQKVLREAEQVVEIAERPDLIEDRLRLGVTELVACTWLHPYLRAIKAAYPSLTIELTVDLSRHLDEEFSANRLDLTIQTSPFASAASGIVELGICPYTWVAAPGLVPMMDRPMGIADLVPYSIMTHARHTQAYRELDGHAARCGLSSSQIISSSSLASCVQMAADGMGATLLPRALVADELAHGRLVEISVDWRPSPLRFAARYQKDKAAHFLTQAAQIAPEVVREFTKSQP